MKTITFQDMAVSRELFGHHNNNLDKICRALNVTINTRGTSLLVSGAPEDETLAETLIHQLYHILKKNFSLEEPELDAAINTIKNHKASQLKKIFTTRVYKTISIKVSQPGTLPSRNILKQ